MAWARGAQQPAGWRERLTSATRKPTVVPVRDGISGASPTTHGSRNGSCESGPAEFLPEACEHPLGQFDEELRTKVRSWRVFVAFASTTSPTPFLLLLNEFSTGRRVLAHMNFYDGGRYAYLEAGFTDQLRFGNSGAPAAAS
jgi:hypothetical protein